MSFAAWIGVGVGVGAVLSIVFDDPAIIGFGAAFGIMFGIFWERSASSDTDDEPS